MHIIVFLALVVRTPRCLTALLTDTNSLFLCITLW